MTTYKVVRNFVAHAGRLVGPGEHLTLKDQEAKHLLATGQIAPDAVQPSRPKAAAEAPEETATLPDVTPEPIKPPARKRK
ncbi:hypothetical protein [Acidaminococcus provencensis]|uniref:hypothetical protein n=1 Tax=Acidaminococcus provencensis TaxID=2058289 RepID=UPI0022E3D9BF|nr:hypothetical protein [Acidaminococcus provencensis]